MRNGEGLWENIGYILNYIFINYNKITYFIQETWINDIFNGRKQLELFST